MVQKQGDTGTGSVWQALEQLGTKDRAAAQLQVTGFGSSSKGEMT